MMRKHCSLFAVFLLFFCCETPKKSESNIWVGSEIYFKGNTYRKVTSNKLILDFNNLTSYHVGLMKYNDSIHIIDSINTRGSIWRFKNKGKDKMTYEFNDAWNYIMTFMRLKKGEENLSFDEVLSKSWFRTVIKENESFVIDEDYDFRYPQLTINRHYYLDHVPVYSERESYKLDTLTVNNHRFFVFKQNNAIFLDQIMQSDASRLSLFNYNSLHGLERKFTDAPIEKKETSFKCVQNFEICISGDIAQYYYDEIGISNSRNRQEKLAYFLKHYNYPLDSNENGYIRIRFMVNCKGKIGRFSLQEMDRDYKEKRFPIEITQQLFDLVSQLDGWLPSKWKQSEPVDYYVHVGFKIKNGKIEEILP